ncbi:MAG: hypothetical protein IJ574_05860 [Bacilli bacterium]|nr:hypothetical protein [Bacilli bacterium]
MKKIYLLLLSILLIIPMSVKADMSAPYIEPYEATVSNPDGAIYYNMAYSDKQYLYKEDKLAYGKKIKIDYEEKINNDYYGSYFDENKNRNYYIKLSDIIRINKKYTYDESDYKKAKDGIVLYPNGIVMKSGPSAAFDDVAVVPGNTKLELKQTKDIEYNDSGWYLTTYKGKTGFVCELEGAIGYELAEENNGALFTSTDLDIKNEEGDTIEVIPANTLIEKNNKKYDLDAWSRSYYIEYNGVKGYISYLDLASENLGKLNVLYDNIKLYEKGVDTSKVLVKSLPKNEELDAYYSSCDWGSCIYYVKYKDNYGWILKTYIDDETETVEFKESGDVKPLIKKEENKKEEKEDSNEEEVIEVNTLTNREIVIYSVGGAIILALTMIVIIMLVNKKKNSKVNNNYIKDESNHIEEDLKESSVIEDQDDDNNDNTEEDDGTM